MTADPPRGEPSPEPVPAAPLPDQGSLAERIARLEALAESDTRAWKPSNVLSAVAIVVSLLFGGISIYRDSIGARWGAVRELGQTIENLTSVEKEIARVAANAYDDPAEYQAAISLANRRLALLESANRLVERLGDEVTGPELAILGASYSQVNEYERAEDYFRRLGELGASPTLQAAGWRSLGNHLAAQGVHRFGEAREAFRKSVVVLAQDQNVSASLVSAENLVYWGQAAQAYGFLPEAMKQYLDARDLYARLPCIPARERFLKRVEQQVAVVAGIDDEAEQLAIERTVVIEVPCSPTAMAP